MTTRSKRDKHIPPKVNDRAWVLLVMFAVAFLLMSMLTCRAFGATYYVQKVGNDGNTGTSWGAGNSWLTLTNVNDTLVFKGGDSVIIGTGIWREELWIKKYGTNDNKTYYLDSAWVAGTTDSRVAWIYGSDSLHTWTQVAGNVYKCSYTPGVMDNYVGVWQGDSILLRQTSSSLSEGEAYYASNEVFVWIYGGGDPDTLSVPIEIGQRGVVWTREQTEDGDDFAPDNWVLQGLGFKYSHGHMLSSHDTGRDELGFDSALISHCYFACNSGEGNDNASLISIPKCGDVGEYDPADSTSSFWLDGADYNRIVACSLGQNYAHGGGLPQVQDAGNGGGINLYSWRYSVIDSNIFWGHLGNDGALKFKTGGLYSDSGAAVYDTIRFNTFDCGSDDMLHFWVGYHIVIYGNTFHNTQDFIYANGIYIRAMPGGVAWNGYYEIYNNTFYNAPYNGMMSDDNGEYDFPNRGNKFKYNIIYQTTGIDAVRFDSSYNWIDVDSNMYYTESGTNTFETNGPTWDNYSFAQWQALKIFWDGDVALADTTDCDGACDSVTNPDANSTDDVDPGFTDAANGNYTRAGASGEMNRTFGGFSFTIYGAIQNAVAITRDKLKGFKP